MSIIFKGFILASAPSYGMALVVPDSDSAPGVKPVLAATLPIADAAVGACVQSLYPTGTAVICRADSNGSPVCAIISAANDAVNTKKTPNLFKSLYNITEASATDQKSEDALIDTFIQSIRQYWHNRSEGVDRDALPGDIDIVDINGLTGLHVGRDVATLRGATLARIDVSGITEEARISGIAVHTDTPATESVKSTRLSVDNVAVSSSEAFGLKEGPVLKKEGDLYKAVADSAIPLYRLQSIAGEAAAGKEEIVVDFPHTSNVHAPDTEPSVLSRVRRALSGDLSEASALGIRSVKTPFVQALQQLGYGKIPTHAETFSDLRTQYKYEAAGDEEDKDTQSDTLNAAIDKPLLGLLSEDYSNKLKKALAGDGLAVASKESSIYSRIAAKEGVSLDAAPDRMFGELSGPATGAEYPLPKQITLTDPVTGKSHTYFASESFISQEPDGSILICDGYGSEIRMSGGNIYISSALDTFIRPGRDLSAMVPGHQSYNSQKSCTINSTDSVYVRAVGDLKMGAGSGQDEEKRKGSVVIDCMSKNPVDGIILQTKSQLTATGANVYIGRNTAATQSGESVTEPSSAGSVIIDAGANGAIVERSIVHTVESGDVSIGAVQGDRKNPALLKVADSRISLYAQQVHAPAAFTLAKMDKPPTMSVWGYGGELKDVSISVQTGGGSIFTPKSLIVIGDVKVDGSMIVNEGINTKAIAAVSAMGQIDERRADLVFNKTSNNAVATQDARVDGSYRKAATRALYCDLFLSTHKFWFPQTYEDVYTTTFPGMRWQINTLTYKTEDIYSTWAEDYVKNDANEDTACYPGVSVWQNADITQGTDRKQKLSNGYITNTRNKKGTK